MVSFSRVDCGRSQGEYLPWAQVLRPSSKCSEKRRCAPCSLGFTGTLLVLVVVSLITMQPSARPVPGFTLIGLVDGGKPSGSSLTPER